MSLKDLEEYKTSQEMAIGKLSVLDPEGDACTEWIPFRDHLWGKPLNTFLVEEEVVERDDRPIKAVPADPPVTRSVATLHSSLPWEIGSRKILVRSEYKEAEEAAVRANKPNTHAFVVGGQPGIGLFPSPPHRLQNLIFDQGNPFFYFTSSCAVSCLSSQQYCRLPLPTRSFSTKAVSPSYQTSTTATNISRYVSHKTNIPVGYGFSLT